MEGPWRWCRPLGCRSKIEYPLVGNSRAPHPLLQAVDEWIAEAFPVQVRRTPMPVRMRAFLPIAGLGVGQTFIWAGTFYFFPALLAVWEADLGWSKSALSLGFTLSLGVSALASPAAGQLIDRGYGKWVLAGSALLCAAFLLALSEVETLWGFYFIWIALGVGMAGGLYEPCFAFLIWAMGGGARRAITAVTLIAGFAGTVSFPTANFLAEHRDWRFACLVFAAVNALAVAPMFWLAARIIEQSAERRTSVGLDRRGGLGAAVRSPVFWLVGATVLLIALAHGMMITHLLSMLSEWHVAPKFAVLAASMIGPMQVAGRIALAVAGGNLSAVSGTSGYLFGLAAGYFLLLAASWDASWLAPFVILYGASWGVASILKPLAIRDLLGDREYARIAGVLAAPFLAASAIGPVAGSLLWEVGGYSLMVLAGAVMSLAALGSHLFAVRIARRRA